MFPKNIVNNISCNAGYVQKYNSLNSQPDVLKSLYSPLQQSSSLEDLRFIIKLITICYFLVCIKRLGGHCLRYFFVQICFHHIYLILIGWVFFFFFLLESYISLQTISNWNLQLFLSLCKDKKQKQNFSICFSPFLSVYKLHSKIITPS